MVEKLNPYTLCPCKSGKKFKFCCASKGNAFVFTITDAQNNPRKIVAIPQYTGGTNDDKTALQEIFTILGSDAFFDVKNLEKISEIIAKNPDCPKVKFHYANLLRDSGNEEKSQHMLNELLDKYPNNWYIYTYRMLQASFSDEIYTLFENFPWMDVIATEDLLYFLYVIGGIRKKQGNEELFKEIKDIISVVNPNDPVIAQYGDK
jgi:hypothetical protein